MVLALVSAAQEWSESAHYNSYLKGNWKEVVSLGESAKKANEDYYYIRARNGYANFMLGRFFKAEKEFEQALKFNQSDAFSKRYGYWSSMYAGNEAVALFFANKLTTKEQDSIKTVRPKFFNSVSFVGGYRFSPAKQLSIQGPLGRTFQFDSPSSMPYVAFYLNHQFGYKVTLNQAVSYLSLERPGQLTSEGMNNISVWQVGYLASLSIQVAKKTTITPSFIMQYWEAGQNKVYDLNATLAVRQQFGNVFATAIGGYFQDTDTNRYMVGGSLTWYPLQNQRLFSITSSGFNFGGDAPNPFVRQTIGGNIFKRAWVRSSFTWNNRVIAFEDVGVDFVNNSSDRLNWLWSISPSYFINDKLSLSVSYSIESRQLYLSGQDDLTTPIIEQNGEFSANYNIHSFYLGLNYNF